MASKDSHLALARRNQAVLDYLLQDAQRCAEWIVTVAFYKTLHLVEALFDYDGVGHGQSHESRDCLLKTRRRYDKIYRHYRPLWAASVVARYLADPRGQSYVCFTDYLPADEIKGRFLDHHLRQIEQSVARLMNIDLSDFYP